MKRRTLLFFIMALTVITFINGKSKALSFELRPYFEVGTQIMDEPGDKGSRSNIGIGVKALFDKGDLDYWLKLGLWTTFEPTDEKVSAPTGAKYFSIGGRYKLYKTGDVTLNPFFTVGWENWKRNLEPGIIGRFEEIQFLFANAGARFQRDKIFLDLGVTYPFWNETDKDHSLSGRLGYTAFLGFETKMVIFGISGNIIGFNGDDSQPDFNFSRVLAKFIFKIPF